MSGLRVFDIFCGAGGFSCGFEQAGFDIEIGFDLNEDALRTFVNNHNADGGLWDLQEMDPGTMDTQYGLHGGLVDVMIGGPPCKGFSTMGERDESDVRNRLYYCAIDYVNHLSPDVVLFENVVGLKSMEDGRGENVLDNIVQAFELCENPTYNVSWRVFDAVDFGVPQTRKRLLVCAVSENLHFTSEDVLSIEPDESERSLEDVVEVEDRYDVQTSPANEGRQLRQETALRGIDEPSYTIKADVPNSLLNSDDLPVDSIKDIDSRRLTIDEIKRVQSFPDDYEFHGDTKTSMYKQIGHAVPPQMAYHFAVRIRKLLQGEPVDGGLQTELGSF
ncbi:DNA (cytosine-5-)-methyltransferase [Halosimplex rubrum]|uniref:DNA (cytosine-5-)-methyltransferase n=1 Tax=Halosimplex rubrum TaxID=869889 RepID=A0A7D5TDH9_9EURY|nr:DNA (cytosine-5-)-methyltransferase [Halosimplex rubrum]QLH78156.1 DNA (cytosine-5-)-methyltransferase [Halosimplex rubrum]